MILTAPDRRIQDYMRPVLSNCYRVRFVLKRRCCWPTAVIVPTYTLTIMLLWSILQTSHRCSTLPLVRRRAEMSNCRSACTATKLESFMRPRCMFGTKIRHTKPSDVLHREPEPRPNEAFGVEYPEPNMALSRRMQRASTNAKGLRIEVRENLQPS